MVTQASIQHHEILYSSYAMGWIVVPYRGTSACITRVSVDGFFAMMVFLPRDNFGRRTSCLEPERELGADLRPL